MIIILYDGFLLRLVFVEPVLAVPAVDRLRVVFFSAAGSVTGESAGAGGSSAGAGETGSLDATGGAVSTGGTDTAGDAGIVGIAGVGVASVEIRLGNRGNSMRMRVNASWLLR